MPSDPPSGANERPDFAKGRASWRDRWRRNSAIGRTTFVAAHLLLGLLLLSPIYIEPDSVGTYSWLRSAVFDHDFLFFNEWASFDLIPDGYVRFKEVTDLSTLANHWGIGTSVLAAPFYLLIRLSEVVIDVPARAAGLFGIYGLGLASVSVLFSAVTLIVLDRILLERGASRVQRIMTNVGIWLGTPLFWYEFRFPLGTHTAGALCVGFVCWLIARSGEQKNWEVVALGLAFGLAVATRIQHLTLLPGIVFALASASSRYRSFGLFAAGSAPPLLVQALAWFVVYGSPTGPVTAGANLAGSTWAPFQRITFDAVLFSSFHGLISWSPVVVLSMAGWWMARKRDRRLAITFFLMFLFELVANATMDRYFWGGMAFGARRFVDLAVPFGFGLWYFVRTVRPRVAVPILLGTVAWSVSLVGSAMAGGLDLLHDVSWPTLLTTVVDLDWISTIGVSTLNSPLAFPSALPHAIVAIALILIVYCGALPVFRRPRVAVVIILVAMVASAGIILSMLGPTRLSAPDALKRFDIRLPLASRAGPLLDQRALLLDELAYYRRTGRQSSARRTIEELRAIDRLLAEDGLIR